MDLYAFADRHTVAIAVVVMWITVFFFMAVRMYLRSRNIKNAGWPPEHLDADGDFMNNQDDDDE